MAQPVLVVADARALEIVILLPVTVDAIAELRRIALLAPGFERIIAEGEAGWRDLFGELGVAAYDVVYEDLVTHEGYRAAILGIAEHVGVSAHQVSVPTPRSHRQSDDTNEEWLARYTSDRQRVAQ